MSGRLDRLPANTLMTTIDKLEHDLDEMKSAPQFISGSSVVYFISQAAATYDWTGLLPDSVGLGQGGKLFKIEAVAQSMDVMWGNVYCDVYTGSPLVKYYPDDALTAFISGGYAFTTSFTDIPNDTNSPNTRAWFCSFIGDATINAAIKFHIEGLDYATITITAIT